MGKKEEGKKESQYDVLIGYVHNWEYLSEHGPDQMSGHPMVGRCYRIIKDHIGYRLHIGRENNDAGLDGLFLGPELQAKRKDFEFSIEIITPQNILSLDITSEDNASIAYWVETENLDLWDKIKMEEDGSTPVVRSLSDLFELIKLKQHEEEARKDGALDIIELIPDSDDITAEVLSNALNKINGEDKDVMSAIAASLNYIANTYDNPRPLTRFLSINPKIGRGPNIWYSIKQLENYVSGEESTSKVEDLYVAIHHLLLEIQRRQNTTDMK